MEKRVEYDGSHSWYSFPKGSAAEGEPLPYHEKVNGKDWFVIPSPKWTRARIQRYQMYALKSESAVEMLLGDQSQRDRLARIIVLRRRPPQRIYSEHKAPVLTDQEKADVAGVLVELDTMAAAYRAHFPKHLGIKQTARKLLNNEQAMANLREVGVVEAWDWGKE